MQESMRVISGGNTGNAARLWHTPLRTRAAVRPALRQGAALAVGLAGGWAVLYGALLPFGPGLALGLGEDCFAASAAGAALGLLIHGFGALSLQSICLLCGLGAIVAGRWLWPGRFLPAAAAGGAALACSAFCLSLGAEGGGVELLLFCGADALLAGAIGFGLRRFPPEKPGAGTLLPAMACAAALGSLALGPLVLGVAACAAAEYLLCCQGKGRAALALCAATGAARCAVDPELAPAAAGLSCATGAAALLAPGRRVEALAAYAGSAIAKGNPMKTGINATKLAIAAFIVPYIFAYSPAMLFVNVTSVWAVIQIVLSALLGIFGVAAGLEGFMLRKMNWLLRLICIGGGLGLMIPGALSDLVGLVLIGGVFAIQYVQNKKEALCKD